MNRIDQFRNDIRKAIELASGGNDSDISGFKELIEAFIESPSIRLYNHISDKMGKRGVNQRLRREFDQKWRPNLLMPSEEVTKQFAQILAAPSRPKPAKPLAIIEDLPPKREKPLKIKEPAAPKIDRTDEAVENAVPPLRSYYEEIDLLTRTFRYREPAPANPNEAGMGEYRKNDLTAFLDILKERKAALAIGRRGFDIDGGWARYLERSLFDDLQQVVVTDLSQPADGAWRSEIEKIERSFPDDRTAGVLILKYGDEFINQNGEMTGDSIDESFIQSVRSHFLLHPNPQRRVAITGTSAWYSGMTTGHMLAPLLKRLFAESDAPISGMALNLMRLNHRQVAEMLWGRGYDKKSGYNQDAVKYMIKIIENHLPLLPAFMKYVQKENLKPLNFKELKEFENRIALMGSRLSDPRPGSRSLLTVTTRSEGVPDWYRSRLNDQTTTYGRVACAPCVSHTIFNVNIAANPAAIMARPAPVR